MKLFAILMLALLMTGCTAWPGFLSPEVIKELKDDHASVCFELHGGVGGVPYGVTRFCRANSEGHSKLEVKPDGSIVVEHNINPKP